MSRFHHINPHNLRHLLPAWGPEPFDVARSLNEIFGRASLVVRPWDRPQRFNVLIQKAGDVWSISIGDDDQDGPNGGRLGMVNVISDEWAIAFPVNEILRGAPSLHGTHCVYLHSIEGEVPTPYIGITRRPWFERWSEHLRGARSGSSLLFHRALREKEDRRVSHVVISSLLSESDALDLEESLVQDLSLYPLGLNMIPGGRAGIRYLASLGFAATGAADRDAAIEIAVGQSTINGRPNPLCAARWESDPDFRARVICGHSGRLTVEQIRTIRLMGSVGSTVTQIAQAIGDRDRRVAAVLSGQRYARVA